MIFQSRGFEAVEISGLNWNEYITFTPTIIFNAIASPAASLKTYHIKALPLKQIPSTSSSNNEKTETNSPTDFIATTKKTDTTATLSLSYSKKFEDKSLKDTRIHRLKNRQNVLKREDSTWSESEIELLMSIYNKHKVPNERLFKHGWTLILNEFLKKNSKQRSLRAIQVAVGRAKLAPNFGYD